ncbi:hypothetical protein [Ottowia testudinis]|uniref:Cytochrome c domain-containing protein n=1 Tax=Ottowia testudinis TaxID=2816950 RepID=A0A975CHC2_9BURK|nr:hypothetical protein [Ottowia testudinis]QTD46210.1 hypothetical protein J1M35_04715 [Ottowia testudinis]
MSHSSMIRGALACALLGVALSASAQVPAIFKGADLKLGEKLIAEHKCNQCHAQKWADGGQAIYRPQGRVNSPARLVAMVEQCSTQMNLGLFPEDVAAVAAVLNQNHYKFKN